LVLSREKRFVRTAAVAAAAVEALPSLNSMTVSKMLGEI
jgi:hypothetical protein